MHFNRPQELRDTDKLEGSNRSRKLSQSRLDIDVHDPAGQTLTDVEKILHQHSNRAHVGLEVVLGPRQVSARRNQIAKVLVGGAHRSFKKIECGIAPSLQRRKVHRLQGANAATRPSQRKLVSTKPAHLLERQW